MKTVEPMPEADRKLAAADEISYLPMQQEVWFKTGIFHEMAEKYAAIHSLPAWKTAGIARIFEMNWRHKIESGADFSAAMAEILNDYQ